MNQGQVDILVTILNTTEGPSDVLDVMSVFASDMMDETRNPQWDEFAKDVRALASKYRNLKV